MQLTVAWSAGVLHWKVAVQRDLVPGQLQPLAVP